jgi:hypothetical protein
MPRTEDSKTSSTPPSTRADRLALLKSFVDRLRSRPLADDELRELVSLFAAVQDDLNRATLDPFVYSEVTQGIAGLAAAASDAGWPEDDTYDSVVVDLWLSAAGAREMTRQGPIMASRHDEMFGYESHGRWRGGRRQRLYRVELLRDPESIARTLAGKRLVSL